MSCLESLHANDAIDITVVILRGHFLLYTPRGMQCRKYHEFSNTVLLRGYSPCSIDFTDALKFLFFQATYLERNAQLLWLDIFSDGSRQVINHASSTQFIFAFDLGAIALKVQVEPIAIVVVLFLLSSFVKYKNTA